MSELDDVYREQERQRAALSLAFQRLGDVALDMQGQVRLELNRAVSGMIGQMTGGRYDRLYLDEGARLVFLKEGRRIPADRVSRGTMEQAYLALRLAASDLLYEEPYPLILDDTFACYDDRRLGPHAGLAL